MDFMGSLYVESENMLWEGKKKCKHYEILNNEVFDGTKQCPDHGVPQDSSCKVAIKKQEIELSSKEK
jgi:hypothetical protein